jgi:hypothetical protein
MNITPETRIFRKILRRYIPNSEVQDGQEFRCSLNAELDFVSPPAWRNWRVPRRGRGQANSRHAKPVALMARHDAEVDAGHGWAAEMEVQIYCAQPDFCGGDNCVSWAVFG